MNIALLNFGASHNFIALPNLKQFAPNSKEWRGGKPLQIKLVDKPSIISLQIATLFVHLFLEPLKKLLNLVWFEK